MPKVLIIDDDPDMLKVMGDLFEATGATVERAGSGEEGRKLVQKQMGEDGFDFVVVDIRMPNMSGNQFAEKIKADGYPGKIVAFTVNATMLGRQKSQSVGIDGYFAKSSLNEDLVRAIIEQYGS